MILINNRNILRIKNRDLLNILTEMENRKATGNVIVEPSKMGIPTLKLVHDGKTQYIHSKYDPKKDAERLVSKFRVEAINHVLFVGVGLGYHIQEFTQAYPNIPFSIYEPNEEVLLAYFSYAELEKLPLKNLIRIFTGTSSDNITNEMHQLLDMSKGMLGTIILPTYEKVHSAQIAIITKKIMDSLKNKGQTLTVNALYQKRWTVNSIKNFPMLLKTPNILHDIDKSLFDGKPAIIVAAGPSLNEEIEHLRYIKDNGLAYIFSVGSAINSLVASGIYPDATCTYDPQVTNYKVIQIIKDKKLSEIPLIFGSSVGFETLEDYPGKMMHMITSQDTIAPAFLKHNQFVSLDYVYDAPSIAVITFQLLSKLGFDQIILVGQNLAYIADEYYAKAIDSSSSPKEKTLQKALFVKDVHGDDVKTTEGLNNMRKQLEMHIARSKHVNVINTTKKGAAIEGTVYKPLNELIEQQLHEKVVSNEWLKGDNDYNRTYLVSQLINLDGHHNTLKKSLQNGLSHIEIMQQKVTRNTLYNIEIDYNKLTKEFEHINNNSFYKFFIEPMIRVQIERFTDSIRSAHYEKNNIQKYDVIVQESFKFLTECTQHYYFSLKLFEEMKEELKAQHQNIIFSTPREQ